MKDLDEAREKALSVQSQLNAANTTLKYTEAELKQTGERLSEKSEALSKHLGESQATIARQERELASERAETERLSAAVRANPSALVPNFLQAAAACSPLSTPQVCTLAQSCVR